MATLTIRKVDDAVKKALREQAASHGVSMEEEVRQILSESVRAAKPKRKLTVEEILAYGMNSDEPFDQKAVSDELWAYIGKE